MKTRSPEAKAGGLEGKGYTNAERSVDSGMSSRYSRKKDEKE